VQIGSQTIPNLEAPLDLDAKTVRVGFSFVPRQTQHTLKAVVDPDGRIMEINESNNVAVAECATPLVPPKQHSSP
jgi:subtilase family serine protease